MRIEVTYHPATRNSDGELEPTEVSTPEDAHQCTSTIMLVDGLPTLVLTAMFLTAEERHRMMLQGRA